MSSSCPWPRAVVLDLDGTLVDSAPDIAEALTAGMAVVGGPAFDAEGAKTLIGGGAKAALARALASAGMRAGDSDQARMYEAFMIAYRAASARGTGLYPGADAMLARFRGRGVRLAVCTNKAHDVTLIALDALRIRSYFGSIVGATEMLPKKPDPAMVLAALSGLAADLGEAVMVGDSAADVGAARGAGIPVIAVSFGYAHGPVASLGADAIVDRLADVEAAIETLATARPRAARHIRD